MISYQSLLLSTTILNDNLTPIMIFSTSMSANHDFLAWGWSVGPASVSAGSSSHEIMTFFA